MHTKDYLAAVLRDAGLELMAKRAETGYYHDFLSPLSCPATQLYRDLTAAGTPAALLLRNRHQHGDFDASEEESDTWARNITRIMFQHNTRGRIRK